MFVEAEALVAEIEHLLVDGLAREGVEAGEFGDPLRGRGFGGAVRGESLIYPKPATLVSWLRLTALTTMRTLLLPFVLSSIAFADTPKLPGIGEAMGEMIAKGEVAGAVTVVVKKDGVLHLEANGMADMEKEKAMSVDTMCRIASMTKPVTGVAIMML